ncbi:MAG: SxtJ family membrane protein [Elusimicrobia bacterium]|nr:SxtJ family membrane protein [Elusimicrobiota bacterium]
MNPENDEKRAKDLKILAILAVACLLAGRLTSWALWYWLALALLAAALFFKKTAAVIADGWLKFGHTFGTINSRIILTLVFYLALTPLAFIKKLFSGGDTLKLKKKSAGESYYEPRNHLYVPTDLEKPW